MAVWLCVFVYVCVCECEWVGGAFCTPGCSFWPQTCYVAKDSLEFLILPALPECWVTGVNQHISFWVLCVVLGMPRGLCRPIGTLLTEVYPALTL